MRYCYGCFQSMDENTKVCPCCGFSEQRYNVEKWVLPLGTVLNNKYIIGKKLGEGGFGITYVAWDTILETRVAIKEYYPESIVSRDISSANGNTVTTVSNNRLSDFEDGLRRYVNEATNLAKFFSLPGIVTIKEFFCQNATAYIVMEYIDGISMKEFLGKNQGKLSVDETLRLMNPIISSLAVIHRNRMLHRDISPDNIMIAKNGDVKLIDFGSARYFETDANKSMTIVLKHGYAPVEQYSRKGGQGEWTDVYALCAVMYRMITGTVPEESVERISFDNLVPIRKIDKKIPKHIANAIEKGLSVMPEDRQQSMEELYSELYASKQSLKEQRFEKIYSACKIFCITAVIATVVILGAVIAFSKREDIASFVVNKIESNDDDKNDNKKKKTEKKDTDKEDNDKEDEDNEDTDNDKEEREKEDNKKENNSEDERNNNDEKEADITKEETEHNNVETVPDNEMIVETVKETVVFKPETYVDSKVSHGIIVARDGVLDGYSESYTVGNMLDMYSDATGTWTGYTDGAGQVFITYSGIKNQESFSIEFQVYSNDTFKLVGATSNGEEIETYSVFFQQILNSIGM